MQGQPPGVNPYAPPTATADAWALADATYGDDMPAERGTRLIAHIVDNLLFVGAAIPGAVGFFATSDGFGGSDAAVFVMYAWMLPLVFLFAAYQWYLIATTGQSLAKRWFKIKIVRMSGMPVGFLHGVLLRAWIMGAMNAVCNFVSLVDALAIFGQQSRCIHDYIADTKVIRA
jgi:uncharacterized RDD family membrane protein YckC